MLNTMTPLEEIDSQLAFAKQRESELESERAQVARELADAESAAGNAYLDGRGDEAAKTLLRIRTRVDLIDRAITAAHDRQTALMSRRLRAEATLLREQAAEKQSELDQLRRDAEPHLRALSELEGVAFNPWILYSQITPETEAFDYPAGGPWTTGGGDFGPSSGATFGPVVAYQKPRRQLLREEIADLNRRAAELEAQTVTAAE